MATVEDLKQILTVLLEQFNVSVLINIMAFAIGSVVGFIFAYWAIRKLAGMITTAFTKGKIDVSEEVSYSDERLNDPVFLAAIDEAIASDYDSDYYW